MFHPVEPEEEGSGIAHSAGAGPWGGWVRVSVATVGSPALLY